MDHRMIPPERFDPDDPKAADLTVRRMFERYELAAGFFLEGNITDVGCGVGYGTAILADCTGARPTGIDDDEDALAIARNRYGYRCDFQQMDASIELPSTELVVAIDFIEHLKEPEGFASLVKVAANRVFIGWPLYATAGVNPYHLSAPSVEDIKGWFNPWTLICDSFEPGSSQRYRFLAFTR